MTVDIAAAVVAVGETLSDRPELLLVLGSGLSSLAGPVEAAVEVPFGAVPGYPAAGVAGHAGGYVAGRIAGRSVLIRNRARKPT